MVRFRPLPVMTVLAVAALAVLLVLGRWQFVRYEERMRERETPPTEMTISAYEPVETGVQLVYGLRDGAPGWRVFTPVREGDAVVFVDAAFIEGPRPPPWQEVRVPAALRYDAPVRGAAIRPQRAGPLAPPPRPIDRVWYSVDLPAMARSAGVTGEADFYIAAPYVGDDGRAAPNPFARTGADDPLPPARHLGYALTWWGLALVLVAVYFAYHLSVRRLRIGAPHEPEL